MKSEPELSRGLVVLLAAGAAFAVASLYYAQPILGVLESDLGAGEREVGLVATMTQLGYAAGILLLAPLGDRYDRRHIIVMKAGLLAVVLVGAGLAPTIHVLWVASLGIGLAATLAQDIVPAAATLAPEARRGKVVGSVMTGLLLGILVSRVVSGFVAEYVGWRAVFLGAAGSVVLIAAALGRVLPAFASTSSLSYRALVASMFELFRRHRALRVAAVAQALLSVGFSAFWSTLAVWLHRPPYSLSSTVVGLYGLAGAAGALAAPIAGGRSDAEGPDSVARLGAVVAAAGFAVMLVVPSLSVVTGLVTLAGAAIVFDFGAQTSLVAHQTIIYTIDPAARSRLNAVLLFTMFVGMSAGSALGIAALARWGWHGVAGLALACSVAAWGVRRASA
jgi:predicted MFS family arabinose efflux permease